MDNKYANLPGIARNEPDVYETTNIVASGSEKFVKNEDDSTSVQKILINTKEAHEKFNAKTLNSDYADFSDSITNRRKFGYRVEPDVYEWNQDPVESPLQRFKRLEKELIELRNDLNEMDKHASDEDKKQLINFDPVELAKQVEGLQNQVNSLHLESIGAQVDVSQLDNKAKKQILFDQLTQLKKNLNSKEKKEGKTPSHPESSIVFKLFADLEANDIQKANKIAEINQRISNLEKIFGAGNAAINERQINTLCSNLENKSIMGLVENLNSKVSLVDSQSLEQIESRLQMVIQRVNQLNEKKTAFEDQEKLNRVNELYSMVTKWKDISVTVPSIVERLASLNDIHQKAFQFPSILSRLDMEQQTIKEKLELSFDNLNKLKTNLDANLESIKKNFDVLNEKIVSGSVKST